MIRLFVNTVVAPLQNCIRVLLNIKKRKFEVPLLISGQTKLMGVLGWGISHTLSPIIHNHSIQTMGLDLVYLPLNIRAESLKPFLRAMWDAGALGFNVTMPLKRIAGQLVGGSSPSVNTIYRGSLGWQGASTDSEGLSRAISRILNADLSSFSEIVVLGAGGVLVALADYLGQKRSHGPRLHVLRRNSGNDDSIRSLLPETYPISFYDFKPEVLTGLLSRKYGECLLIQATSAPLHGDSLDGFAPSLELFHGFFAELTYGCASALLATARSKGLPCIDGIPMLIEQARLSQQLWWQREDSYGSIFSALEDFSQLNQGVQV